MPRWWLSIWPFLPALLAPLGVLDSADELVLEAYLANALLVMVATPLVVGVHECGHAIAGVLLGGRVHRIQIGSGRRLGGFELSGVPVQLSATPAGGMTWISPPSGPLPRVREWLWTLAGPLADVGVVALLLAVSNPADPARWLIGDGLASDVSPLQVIALVATLQLVYQLLYLTVDGDLVHLLRLPFRRPASLSADAARVEALCVEGRLDEALEVARETLDQRQDPSLRGWLANVYLSRQEPQAAREALAPSFEAREALPTEARRDLEAAWAWTLAFVGDAAAACEAVRLAAALHRDYPNRPWFTGIYGAALVAAGRLDEGIPLLRAAYDENIDPEVRAHDAAWIAMAEERRGRLDDATRWRAQAAQLDPDCYSLRVTLAPGE